jgi:predicted KAP-like P-loop ATPase
VWSNLHYSSDSAVRWSRDRLVCSEKHFESYFRFTIGDDVLPAAELKSIVARASDINFVKAKIHQALNIKRKDGTTKAKLILEELSAHAEEIAEQDVPSLLNVLFQLGDELDVDSDKAGGFSIGDNQLRIHWLLRSLTLDRFDLASRSRFFLKASEDAALGWLVDFSGSSYRDYHPREGKQPEPEQNCLTTAEDAELLQEMALRRIRSASASGELAKTKRLAYLMYSWRELARDDGAEVKAWAAKQMQDDMMIATFSKAFTSYTWSQGLGMAGLGDTVAKRGTRANVDSLDSILDRRYLRERVEQLAAGDQSGNDIKEFLSAWKRHDKNPRD